VRWNPFSRTTSDPTSDDLSDHAIWPQVSEFWSSLAGVGFSPRLISRVWVAKRCMQLNAQQIASMPLRFLGSQQPAWVTSPDPVWYPNGIGDAVFSAVWSMYGWGDAFLYVTNRYSDGYPLSWTVLDPTAMSVELRDGVRVFKLRGTALNQDDVVQISLNPTGGLRGTSALSAHGSFLWGSLSSADLARQVIGENPVPHSVLKSQRKLTEAQAQSLQAQWGASSALRRGLPAILPPDIDFQELAFSPKDLMLLDAQEFNARVIAMAFGVPAFMLNMPLAGGLTYQSPEMLVDQWWRLELRPIGKIVSNALSAQMLPRGSSVYFDSREVLAPSLADLHKVWKEALDAQAVTPDEYRRAVLGLEPLGTANAVDELLQPSAAGATPADQPSPDVITLRPNTWAVST
jgi:HK97 family phage portal protein